MCLCVAGTVVRALWQAATSTAILYADSVDSAATWGGPAALFDPGHPCYGIAPDGDLTTVLVAYDPIGLGAARTIPVAQGAGMAFASRDVFSLAGKGGGGVPVWTHGPEPEQLHLARLGDRANHLVIYGPQGAAGAMAKAWDWGDVAAAG